MRMNDYLDRLIVWTMIGSLALVVMQVAGCSKKVVSDVNVFDFPTEDKIVYERQEPVKYVEKELEPIASTILFDFNSDVIRTEEAMALDNLDIYNRKVSVVGHACQIGGDDHNINLSMRRAIAVHSYLQNKGIASEVRWSYRGESEPVTYDESQYQLNRRAEITVE
jgi:outer membrane protein OmpA-like peptidoglycan-associated protein